MLQVLGGLEMAVQDANLGTKRAGELLGAPLPGCRIAIAGTGWIGRPVVVIEGDLRRLVNLVQDGMERRAGGLGNVHRNHVDHGNSLLAAAVGQAGKPNLHTPQWKPRRTLSTVSLTFSTRYSGGAGPTTPRLRTFLTQERTSSGS